MREKKKKGEKKGKSLNLVLWLSFSLFSIVVVLIFAVVQITLVNRDYRMKAMNRLQAAGAELAQGITPNTDDQQAVKLILDAFRQYNALGYMITPDGQSLFPDLTDQKSYPSLAEALNKELSGEKTSVVFSYGNTLTYALETSFGGQECYLCVMTPLESLNDLEEDMGLISFVMVLIATMLAFVVSWFVSVLITNPVNEVTSRAQKLARGDYALDFQENYFCREINELASALDSARDEVFKAQKMQEELIANVSHDFKTPLTMIKAYASLIRDVSDNNKKRRDAHAKIIEDESDRLSQLVSDLLDLSKVRAGFGEDERAVFNLSEEVYSVAGRFDYLKETEGYEVMTKIEDDLYIFANRARIQQVFYNLIGNAVNYTGADKKVKVRLYKRKNGNSRFEVEDTGDGIKKELLPTIWDRYFRTREAVRRVVNGSGFGLSIVKGILEAHGYPFGVVSEEGKGSLFWVEFFPPPAEEELAREAEVEKKAPKKKKKEKKNSSGDGHEV